MLTFSINNNYKGTAVRMAYISKAIKELQERKTSNREVLDAIGIVFDTEVLNENTEGQNTFGITEEDLNEFIYSGGKIINFGRLVNYVKACVANEKKYQQYHGKIYYDASKEESDGDYDLLGHITYKENESEEVIHTEFKNSDYYADELEKEFNILRDYFLTEIGFDIKAVFKLISEDTSIKTKADLNESTPRECFQRFKAKLLNNDVKELFEKRMKLNLVDTLSDFISDSDVLVSRL